MSDTKTPNTAVEKKPAKPEVLAAKSADVAPAANSFDRVLDVRVELNVELGRRLLRISDILELTQGSIVEFQKAAEEPLDVRVNGQLVARGEAVVVGDRYGVRITQVVSPNERLQSSGLMKEESAS